jgi:hypothetical protein
LFGLLFVPKVPARFIQLSAFLWGVMVWVLLSIPAISINGQGRVSILFPLLGMAIVSLVILHIKQKTWLRIPKFATQVGFPTGIFIVLDSALYALHGIAGSPDSIYMVMISKIIATNGFFGHWTMGSPAWFGIDLPLLTLPAWAFQQEYLYSLQPLFLASLLGCFIYFGHYLAATPANKNKLIWIVPVLGAVWLACTPLMFFQFFYIHDNIVSAVYLFLAFMTAWSFAREDNPTWLPFFILSLAGFSLARVESPVFSLIILAILISTGKITYRNRLFLILPYLVFISLWYLAIYQMQTQVYMATLNKPNQLAVLGVQIVFICFILVSGTNWIETRIIPKIHLFSFAAVIIVLAFVFIRNPDLMVRNLLTIYKNLWIFGGWGYIWPLTLAWLLVVANIRIPFERIPGLGGSLYFIFVLLLGSLRNPSKTGGVGSYHVRWSDSANRMLISLLPIIIFYLVIKTLEFIQLKSLPDQTKDGGGIQSPDLQKTGKGGI